MRIFTINNKRYNSVEADFNMICDFELKGVQLQNISKVPTTAIRAYFSYCSGLDEETAGREISAHMMNGGDLSGISDALREAIEESDFFRALTKRETEETPEEVKETGKSKK